MAAQVTRTIASFGCSMLAQAVSPAPVGTAIETIARCVTPCRVLAVHRACSGRCRRAAISQLPACSWQQRTRGLLFALNRRLGDESGISRRAP